MHTVRLPLVYGSGIAAQGNEGGMVDAAVIFAMGWMGMLAADAEPMRCDERLVAAAQWQADWLAVNDFDPRDPHLGVDGLTANERVLMSGYALPGWWTRKANNVESVTRSWAGPQQAAIDLAHHYPHSEHLLRREEFREHVVWGVGAAEAQLERKGTFFVAISAPVEDVTSG